MTTRIHVPIPSHLPGEGIGIYRNMFKAGIWADRYVRNDLPAQRQDIFETIVGLTVQAVSSFSVMSRLSKPLFIDVAVTQPGFGTVMASVLSGMSFNCTRMPAWLYYDHLGDIKPDYCAKILARLPFYLDKDPITALDHHLSKGLHGFLLEDALYSRNLEPVPLLPEKDALWYYSPLGEILSKMAERRGVNKLFDIMGQIAALGDTGTELYRRLSHHISMP
ncbi:MAG: hypothetical protein WC490_04330 [Candidatus Margulisiibacteriota bacterium]